MTKRKKQNKTKTKTKENKRARVYDPVCETLNFCFAESAPSPMCLFTLIGIFHFISLCIIYLFIYSFIYLLFSFNSVCGFRFKFL